ncbi:glutamate-cysteine ligase family protein [Phoenicibacter congonensis]|uniref:glutamate-cysteine ligase family protein n=1 Tax=Phoenicibacter congonensis TaxID=1944646 RepID=UPI0009A7838A|nr:glutamate-cysteine ligase family protein [Phoenicibacter congonensis]
MHNYENHVESMVNFYKSGIKSNSQKLGVELEYTLVYDDNSQVKYFDEFGQKWLMENMLEFYPEKILDEQKNLIGIKNERDSITLEPAGQFELSAGPFEKLEEVFEAFETFQKRVNALAEPHGIKMLAIGYHPKCKAEELVIIPKVRYELMTKYFLKNSPKGIRMMRGTGSTQVSIDYSSEADCIRKLRLAYVLTPLFAILCDNTPMFEGEKRTHHIMRTQVWEDCDPRRCGAMPGIFEDSFNFEKCAELVLNTQAMFEMDGDDGHLTNKTTSEVYGDKEMSNDDCAAACSHLFNDVRLKNFIEIRPADALPTNMEVAYVALIKGIFYSEEALSSIEDYFGPQSETSFEEAKRNLEEKGLSGEVYGMPATTACKKLLDVASLGLDKDEKKYLEPLFDVVSNKKTLADELIQL